MATSDRKWIDAFYRDLRALREHAFHKQCPNCGRVFSSVDEFLDQTGPVHENSGLMECPAEFGPALTEKKKAKKVGLFRNCPCGSTLMVECQDRRRTDLQGVRHRQTFDRLLRRLTRKGIRPDTARTELLAIMKGNRSPVLADLGISAEETAF